MKNLRWLIITLIGIATIINYVDRTSLAVMWKSISADLRLTDNDYATIVFFFMCAYALGQALIGKAFDRIGTRIGLTLTMLVWIASCGLLSLARGIASIGMFRALLGFSEAGNWPGATKTAAAWFPNHERALAQGIFNAGASLGAVVSAPIVAFLYMHLGWKATYLVIGAAGLVWVLPWWFIARSSAADHPWISQKERDYILGTGNAGVPPADEGRPNPRHTGHHLDRGRDARRIPSAGGTPALPAIPNSGMTWGEAVSHRQTWAVLASRFFLDPIWWIFVNWLPLILAKSFGYEIKEIGATAFVPYVGAFCGSLFGGWYSGWRIRQGRTVNRARKQAILLGGAVTIVGFVLAIYALTIAQPGLPITWRQPGIALAGMAFVLCGFQIMINNVQTLPSDFYSGKSVGNVAGLGGLVAVAGVLVFSTWLIPAITKISYVPVFIMAVCFVPLGIVMVYLFGGEIRRVDVSEKHP